MLPGRQLRSARESRGISLDEAARQTCIGSSYLEALEADRYDDLPNPAYVKGIIRSYARTLGVPPEPLIASYLQGTEPEEIEDEQRGGRAPGGKRSWLMLIVIGLLVSLGYLMAQRDTGPELPAIPPGQPLPALNPRPAILSPQTSPPRSVSPPTAAPAVLPPRDEKRSEAVPEPEPGPSVLKARVIAECQLTITIDDMPAQQYDLQPGDQVEWRGERYFALEITNAGAIEAKLNGRQLPPLGRSGDAATLLIRADGQIE